MIQKTLVVLASTLLVTQAQAAQAPAPATDDVRTPLHRMPPNYPVPYDAPTVEAVAQVLQRVHGYLDAGTPAKLVDFQTREEVTDLAASKRRLIPARGAFRLVSYEWGVTYSGMLLAGEATGDKRYTDYTAKRMKLIADWVAHKPSHVNEEGRVAEMIRSILEPRALDDAGAMCAAMIRTTRAGLASDLRPVVDRYIDFIGNKEFRLADKTLARNRPQPNTLWLDDLYMSVPALGEMGKLTGEARYFDDAAKQILQFSERMFDKERGLYMHGWVQGMDVHPAFYWARANGWALLAMSDLLDVLPESHPARPKILEQFRAHVRGLVLRQSGSGFWHQLLDREDSYLETSATAIYAYGIAHGVHQGWLDPLAYGPTAILAWNAVATKVNAEGQVEGTCVGTGMAFDPAFYYHRPTNAFAAHGYGPVLLAGAEVTRLLKEYKIAINDSALQFYRK
jgi:unsaturated rhamnogalacturonyl hydrolase